jgi:hypothetical protein
MPYAGFDSVGLVYRLSNPLSIESGEYGEGTAYAPSMLFSRGTNASIRTMIFGGSGSRDVTPARCTSPGSCAGSVGRSLYQDAEGNVSERDETSL